MRQHQILRVVDAHLVVAEALGEIGDQLHRLRAGIARRAARLLQRDHDGRIARHAMRPDIVLEPIGEDGIGDAALVERLVPDRPRRQLGRREIGHDAIALVLRQVDRVLMRRLPIGLDVLAEFVDAELIDEDLDARLVDVVAAAMQIVHAQDRLDVGEQMLLRQEGADLLPDIGRAAHAAADQHAEAVLAVRPAHDLQADIVEGDGRAILGGAGDGDLELARQPAELGMQRRPLAQDLAPGARVLELVIGGAGERIGGDVAHAIAAGLDAVHLDIGERGQHVGNVDELHPVELQVLPRGEMAVAAIPPPPDHGELAQLLGREHAIGNGDAQHVGVQLEIESVPQAQAAGTRPRSAAPASRRST